MWRLDERRVLQSTGRAGGLMYPVHRADVWQGTFKLGMGPRSLDIILLNNSNLSVG